MPKDDEKEHYHQLIQIIREAIERDDALRKKYEIGDKFRFIRDRLKDLLSQLESELSVLPIEEKNETRSLAQDEVAVYVHLFNSKGSVLKSWVSLLNPSVFYEYSVNRPIYTDKRAIESLLLSKKNKLQHAYLTIAVKSKDIIPFAESNASPTEIAKVKEGTLHFEQLISFTHDNQDYYLDENNELVKK